jgi:branched-chain amino acid transport system substrate-binding protein
MKRCTGRAAVLVLLGLLGACSRQVTVKIGVAAPMTGTLAQFGKDIAQGATIAVDELNGDQFTIGGRRAHFELVIEDDKSTAAGGKAAAKRLIDAGVAGVFGHFNSDVTIAAAPLYANAGIAQVSASTNPRYTRMGLKTTFRLAADDIEQGTALGRLVAEGLHATSVLVIDDRTTFGIGLADQVMRILKAGNINPPRIGIDREGADYAAAVRKAGDSNADVIFYGGDEVVGVPLLKALRAAGIAARFVSGDGMCDAWTVKTAQGAADGNFYCSIAGIPPSWLSGGIGFTDMYTARFGKPGAYAPVAYDGVHILAQAMQRAGSADPDKYLPEMKAGFFDGKVQGSVEFDAKGDMKDGTIVIYRSIGGQLTEQRNMF